MKGNLKKLLKALGLFDLAIRLRIHIRALLFFPANIKFWTAGSADGFPLPSVELITLVAGVPDISWFIQSGKLAVATMSDTLQKLGHSLRDFHSILDFGCGCGRVTRNLSGLGATRAFGTDTNARLIQWCNRNLTFAEFGVNETLPPLPYASNTFDLVYAFSVLTHMPLEPQLLWMAELRRVLKPNGYFLFSTHGERYIEQMSDEEKRQFKSGALVVRSEGEIGSNHFAAYHPPEYVRANLSQGFEVIDFIREGARGNPHQDLFLFKKKG